MRDYEKQVARELLRTAGLEELFGLLATASEEDFEYTKVGYYLTIKHPKLPVESRVLDEPLIFGRSEAVPEVGFLGFVGNQEFTLECHSWGDEDIPDDFRDRDVEVIVREWRHTADGSKVYPYNSPARR